MQGIQEREGCIFVGVNSGISKSALRLSHGGMAPQEQRLKGAELKFLLAAREAPREAISLGPEHKTWDVSLA